MIRRPKQVLPGAIGMNGFQGTPRRQVRRDIDPAILQRLAADYETWPLHIRRIRDKAGGEIGWTAIDGEHSGPADQDVETIE